MIGECGLDYDRYQYADKETQLKVFPKHFELTDQFNLPVRENLCLELLVKTTDFL